MQAACHLLRRARNPHQQGLFAGVGTGMGYVKPSRSALRHAFRVAMDPFALLILKPAVVRVVESAACGPIPQRSRRKRRLLQLPDSGSSFTSRFQASRQALLSLIRLAGAGSSAWSVASASRMPLPYRLRFHSSPGRAVLVTMCLKASTRCHFSG